METLPIYHTLRELVGRGVAFHHSGLLPVLKEVIELLFSGGFLKVMVATETFAVGLNMPTRTVIFTSLRKYADDCDGLRLLRHDEYMQMAGRAGRRGKDVVGHVVYLPEREPVGVFELGSVLKGALPALQSNMQFGYEFLLKALNQNAGFTWMDIIHGSYWYKARAKEIAAARSAVELAAQAMAAAKPAADVFADLEKKHGWEVQLKTAVNAERKALQRTIEDWKNKHLGPRWAKAEKDYAAYLKAAEAHAKAQGELVTAEAYTEPVEKAGEFLERAGYCAGSGLTELGRLASECNECHPLLMSHIFYSGCLDNLELVGLVGFCAGFVDVGKLDDEPALGDVVMDPSLRGVYEALEKVAVELASMELVKSPPNYWKVRYGMIEPLIEWINGSESFSVSGSVSVSVGEDEPHIGVLCEKYGFFEGNFVKAILKVSNILEELASMANLMSKTALLERLECARSKLVRGLVVPDSLYLHL